MSAERLCSAPCATQTTRAIFVRAFSHTALRLLDAAQRRGIRHIVFLSLQGVKQNLSTTHAAEIRDDDDVFVPAGRSFTAFIDARDIGRVAAAVLTEPGHTRRAYTLSGEQSLTYRNVAAILSDVLGRSIHYRRPSETESLSRLRTQGKPEDYISRAEDDLPHRALQHLSFTQPIRSSPHRAPRHHIRRICRARAARKRRA